MQLNDKNPLGLRTLVIRFEGVVCSGDTGHQNARIKAINRNPTWSDRADLAFFTGIAGSGERMRITETGAVGIGTPDPSYTLHVNGSAGLTSGTSWQVASDLRLKDIDGATDMALRRSKGSGPCVFTTGKTTLLTYLMTWR